MNEKQVFNTQKFQEEQRKENLKYLRNNQEETTPLMTRATSIGVPVARARTITVDSTACKNHTESQSHTHSLSLSVAYSLIHPDRQVTPPLVNQLHVDSREKPFPFVSTEKTEEKNKSNEEPERYQS